MRKFIVNILTGLLFVSMAALVSGCDDDLHVAKEVKVLSEVSTPHTSITDGTNPTELCYKGITYVFFSNGNASWGSVRMDTDGTPVECE